MRRCTSLALHRLSVRYFNLPRFRNSRAFPSRGSLSKSSTSAKSRVPIPSNKEPTKSSEARFVDPEWTTEWIESYRPGGLHPVLVGECLHRKYKIVNKLGHGSFSTVWLAHDDQTDSLVALKISRADASPSKLELTVRAQCHSRHIQDLLGHFEVHGPNGVHVCQVLEFLGPSVASVLENLHTASVHKNMQRANGIMDNFDQTNDTSPPPRLSFETAKAILKQVLLAITDLHRIAVCHGDIQPGNILFSFRTLSASDEAKLLSPPLPDRITPPISRRDGREDPWSPKHLYLPVELEEFLELDDAAQVKLSDLGGAFRVGNSPKKAPTPLGLRAPEIVLGLPYDQSIDIWSFGCLVFELIIGKPLFPSDTWSSPEENDDLLLLQLIDTIGPLSEDYVAKWPRYRRHFDEIGNKIRTAVDDEPLSEDDTLYTGPTLEEAFEEWRPSGCSDSDRDYVLTMLRRIFKYRASDRATLEDISNSPFFR